MTDKNSFDLKLPENKIVNSYFCVDSGALYEGFHVPSCRWNGWATPMFELDVAKKIALDTYSDDYHIRWIDEANAFELVDKHSGEPDPWFFKAESIVVSGEQKTVYAIGSGFWCWDDYDSPEHGSSDGLSFVP